ncbi:MAG: glycosyltransferase [Thermoproteota archaeon]|nr:glycosyltransferase [Thermoproteota archaeon]
MRAKVVHDDINAGGGSERLAIVTMDLLTKMGFKVDLASFNEPNMEELKKDFGDIVDSIDVRPIPLDLFSMLGMTDSAVSQDMTGTKDRQSTTNTDKTTTTTKAANTYDNDSEYDLIINTHGDLLPYYNQTADHSAEKSKKSIITYCHFPLVPQLLQEDNNNSQGYMRFLRKWINVDDIEEEFKEKILDNVSKTYDLMIKNTTVVTNSNFSKRAIEQHYGSTVKPVVIYPPVDTDKFHKIALRSEDRENVILVVSRFSPDKQLENIIEIGKILINEIKIDAEIILVGNISTEDRQYLEELKQLIRKYNLDDKVTARVGISFDQLLELMRKSKVYLHPLAGEPFGISIVEAMSAGLIPVVPDEGGYTEFVPEYYQYHTHQQAADVIGKILIASDNNMQTERTQLSEGVSKFSTNTYKADLRKVIETLLSSKSSGHTQLAA